MIVVYCWSQLWWRKQADTRTKALSGKEVQPTLTPSCQLAGAIRVLIVMSGSRRSLVVYCVLSLRSIVCQLPWHHFAVIWYKLTAFDLKTIRTSVFIIPTICRYRWKLGTNTRFICLTWIPVNALDTGEIVRKPSLKFTRNLSVWRWTSWPGECYQPRSRGTGWGVTTGGHMFYFSVTTAMDEVRRLLELSNEGFMDRIPAFRRFTKTALSLIRRKTTETVDLAQGHGKTSRLYTETYRRRQIAHFGHTREARGAPTHLHRFFCLWIRPCRTGSQRQHLFRSFERTRWHRCYEAYIYYHGSNIRCCYLPILGRGTGWVGCCAVSCTLPNLPKLSLIWSVETRHLLSFLIQQDGGWFNATTQYLAPSVETQASKVGCRQALCLKQVSLSQALYQRQKGFLFQCQPLHRPRGLRNRSYPRVFSARVFNPWHWGIIRRKEMARSVYSLTIW
jgi:hypothetical protein